MSRKIKEMEEFNNTLQKKIQEMQRAVIDLGMKQSRLARGAVTGTSTAQVTLIITVAANLPVNVWICL